MLRNNQGGNVEGHPSTLTVPEAAISILQKGKELEKGLGTIVKMLINEGWHVELHEEQGSGTASFSRKNGKLIDVYWHDESGKMKSVRHIIASIVHEYLYGELADEASRSGDPKKYIYDHFREFANLDVEVVGSIDEGRDSSMTGFGLSHHRKMNLQFDMTDAVANRLLSK